MDKLIVHNWKVKVESIEKAKDIVKNIETSKLIKTVICPSDVHISTVKNSRDDISVGSQNISVSRDSLVTGMVSGKQLKNIGAQYVIIGHEEVRKTGVTNKMVGMKAGHAVTSGLTPIICFGGSRFDKVMKDNIEEVLNFTKDYNIVLAYEPSKNIGSEKAMDTDNIKETVEMMREVSKNKFSIIYGGSVNESNVEQIIKNSGIDGILVGRASIEIEKINKITKICQSHL